MVILLNNVDNSPRIPAESKLWRIFDPESFLLEYADLISSVHAFVSDVKEAKNLRLFAEQVNHVMATSHSHSITITPVISA
jgi:hypothetical protein